MGLLGLGKVITKVGDAITTRGLVGKFGKQIGKTSRNGTRVFQKQLNSTRTLTTSVDRSGNVVKQIKKTAGDTYVTKYNPRGNVEYRATISNSPSYTSVERYHYGDSYSQVPTRFEGIKTYRDTSTGQWTRRVCDSNNKKCFLNA